MAEIVITAARSARPAGELAGDESCHVVRRQPPAAPVRSGETSMARPSAVSATAPVVERSSAALGVASMIGVPPFQFPYRSSTVGGICNPAPHARRRRRSIRAKMVIPALRWPRQRRRIVVSKSVALARVRQVQCAFRRSSLQISKSGTVASTSSGDGSYYQSSSSGGDEPVSPGGAERRQDIRRSDRSAGRCRSEIRLREPRGHGPAVEDRRELGNDAGPGHQRHIGGSNWNHGSQYLCPHSKQMIVPLTLSTLHRANGRPASCQRSPPRAPDHHFAGRPAAFGRTASRASPSSNATLFKVPSPSQMSTSSPSLVATVVQCSHERPTVGAVLHISYGRLATTPTECDQMASD